MKQLSFLNLNINLENVSSIMVINCTMTSIFYMTWAHIKFGREGCT
jgi:hypothetical protein